MSRLYLRKTELVISPQSGSTKTISGLRVKFKIEKTNESTPNAGAIEVYNLSETSRSYLEAKNTIVSLKVGYDGASEVIFIGDVQKVKHQKTGCDIISKIEAEDGSNRYQNSRLDKGYPPNISTKQVFRDIGQAMGLPIGSQIGVPDTKYIHGLTLSGQCRDHLDNLCTKNDLEWSIQDNTLQIIPKTGFSLDNLIVLNAKSGLINIPSKTADGVEFESLIQPTLKIGRKVKIESNYLAGIYKLRKVSHEGDNHGGTFLSKCEATA